MSPRPPFISLAYMCVFVCVCVRLPPLPCLPLPPSCPAGTSAVLLSGGGGAGLQSGLGRGSGRGLTHVVRCGAGSLRSGDGEPAPGSVCR